MRVAGHGLAMDPPPGWDVRIGRRSKEAPAALGVDAGPPASTHPVLHAADFSLPERRGDFGSGAVEIMLPDQAFIALVEYHPDSAGTALFSARGAPRRVTGKDFSPRQLQRTIPGHAGFQHFFADQGRAFCLYVVLGSFSRRGGLVPRVNAALERLEIRA